MIKLDGDVRSLLERSHLFDFSGYSSSEGYEAKVKIIPLGGYQFFLPNCFFQGASDNKEYFKSGVSLFLKKYLFAWAEFVKNQNTFDGLDFGRSVLSFFEGLDFEKLFKGLVSGKENQTLDVKPNNTLLQFKRFGDILSVGVKGKHNTGIKTLQALCRREDRNNNQGIYELIDGIKCSVSLASVSKDGVFDTNVFVTIRKVLQCASFDQKVTPSLFVEAYKNLDDRGIQVGKYHDLKIYVDIVHGDAKTAQDIKHVNHYDQDSARVLRQANVEKLSDENFRFKSGKDLILVFTLKSSLPNFLNSMDLGFGAHQEQFKLIQAGSVFCSQLCSMVVNGWLDYRVEIDRK